MASLTKAAAAAALREAGIPSKSFTIPQFCARNGNLSEGFYQKMRKAGKGPRETRVLDRVLITEEAEADWLRDREAESIVPTATA